MPDNTEKITALDFACIIRRSDSLVNEILSDAEVIYKWLISKKIAELN